MEEIAYTPTSKYGNPHNEIWHCIPTALLHCAQLQMQDAIIWSQDLRWQNIRNIKKIMVQVVRTNNFEVSLVCSLNR
uniref:Uncharacterized protein n=1 Tax=Arundo donax TaxID=35708 RepID=A0A0A9FK37_ARUDO